MKRIRYILVLFISLIILVVVILFYQIKTYEPETNWYSKIPVSFCGTYNPILTENETRGKEIFYSNCAACHKKNARSTGPALQHVDSIVFTKWLTNKRNKIDSTKIEKLGIDYHRVTFSKVLNKKEINYLIEYSRN